MGPLICGCFLFSVNFYLFIFFVILLQSSQFFSLCPPPPISRLPRPSHSCSHSQFCSIDLLSSTDHTVQLTQEVQLTLAVQKCVAEVSTGSCECMYAQGSSYMQIFDCAGSRRPNPNVVPTSTVSTFWEAGHTFTSSQPREPTAAQERLEE